MKCAAAWLLAVGGALAVGCANPIPPTGGPEDQTAPRLARADPDTNAVNVSGGTVRLVFSEPLDAASVARSLSVTPDLDRPPAVELRRRREVLVRLGPLRPATTYVLTFDTNLRDERGVALRAPLLYAFSTGPRISRGTLSGRVVEAESGQPRAGVDVYGYAGHSSAADTLPRRPDVRTQTGSDGGFRFQYLGPAPLFVVAVDDRNRNRRVDAGEAVAAPPSPQVRPTDTPADSSQALLTWLLALPDTSHAKIERARSFGPARHALRYDRPVRLSATQGWALRDSTGQPVPIAAVWRDAADPRQAVFATADLPPRPLTVVPPAGAVVDSAGRPARALAQRFTPSTARDTLGLRFAGFSDAVVDADSAGRFRPRVAFSRLPGGTVTATDTTGQPQPVALVQTDDGPAFWIDTRLPAVVQVAVSDSVYSRRFDARSERTLGSLSGVVVRPASLDGPVYVEAIGEDERRTRVLAAPDGTFAVPRLPAGSYRLVAFLDRDGDGQWTPGRPAPYRPAEPLVRLDAPQAVRARWEAALPDTLRLEE